MTKVIQLSSIAQSVEHAAVNRGVGSSSLSWGAKARWLSWLERRPVTAEVVGSSPIWVGGFFISGTLNVGKRIGDFKSNLILEDLWEYYGTSFHNRQLRWQCILEKSSACKQVYGI